MFDRVTSTNAAYPKKWLLHTAGEPMLAGDAFSAGHEEGRLWCRTLLPAQAAMTKVGGPCKQFWADGRNWPLPGCFKYPDTTPLSGQWRVEVSPREAAHERLIPAHTARGRENGPVRPSCYT